LQTERGQPAQILKSTPIAFLGRTSYSIYMVHWLPLVLAAAVLKRTFADTAPNNAEYFAMYRVNPLWGDVGVVAMLILVVAIAAITYRYIEAPWRSFGRTVAFRSEPDMVAHPIS